MANFPIDIATFLERVGDPLAILNAVQVYSKEVAGVTQLFCELSDGTVFQVGPTATQVNTTYYVSSTGNDANDGLTPGTAFLTLTKAESVIPLVVQADFQIRMLDVGPFVVPDFRERVYDGGVLYVRSDVDTTILGSTAAGAGTVISAINGLVLVADTYNGQWIEMLSGAAIGDIRLIRNNTATSIIPVSNFRTAPAPGDTFRILEPSTTLTNALTVSSMSGKPPPTPPGNISGLFFERLVFNNTLRIAATVSFHLVVFKGAVGTPNNGSQVFCGSANGVPETIHSLPANAYRGAGAQMKTNGTITNLVGGFVCALAVIGRFPGLSSLAGGSFPLGIIIDGVTTPAAFAINGASPVVRVTGALIIRNEVLAFLSTVEMVVAAGVALQLSRGCQTTLISPATIAAAAGTAISVESNALLLLDALAAAAVAGSVYGVYARFGGQVRLAGVPNVAGTTAAFAVGEVPTVAAAAAFAAIGVAVVPAVLLDGSVVQRVS